MYLHINKTKYIHKHIHNPSYILEIKFYSTELGMRKVLPKGKLDILKELIH